MAESTSRVVICSSPTSTSASSPDPKPARADIAHVGEGEGGENQEEEQDHDDGPERGLGQAAEGGEHDGLCSRSTKMRKRCFRHARAKVQRLGAAAARLLGGVQLISEGMRMGRRKLVAGNWKMHGLSADLGEVSVISIAAETIDVDVALCLPATLIERAVRAARRTSRSAGRTSTRPTRARIPAAFRRRCCSMPAPALTIVGHSERREAQGETDADVKAKAEAALAAGLDVILCVGESDSVREAGEAVATVSAQLDASLPHGDGSAIPQRFAIAYEPIWAIGTGKVPSVADIAEMHAALRQRLVAAYGDAGSAGPHPLRRVGQGIERRRDLRGGRCRWRAGRGGKPQVGRFPADRRRREPCGLSRHSLATKAQVGMKV